jgi:hypothetical protein
MLSCKVCCAGGMVRNRFRIASEMTVGCFMIYGHQVLWEREISVADWTATVAASQRFLTRREPEQNSGRVQRARRHFG